MPCLFLSIPSSPQQCIICIGKVVEDNELYWKSSEIYFFDGGLNDDDHDSTDLIEL